MEDESTTEDYEEVYKNFWKQIVEKDGVLDLDQVKRELFDFHTLMNSALQVYMHVTNGRISKTNTKPSAVIAVSDGIFNQRLEEAIKDEREDGSQRHKAGCPHCTCACVGCGYCG